MMHKSATTSWVRPTSTFTPAPELGRPPGGSSPVIHFFRDQETGARWLGKVGQIPMREKAVNAMARELPEFLGVYADEILEKLGLAIYEMLGTVVPESALSYQQVTMEAMHPDMLLAMQLNAEDEGQVFELPHSPRMHYLSRYVEEFQPLDKDFVEKYSVQAKYCRKENYVRIQTKSKEWIPLKGLGVMLAAADFLYDLDCLGDGCGNAGYVIRKDEKGSLYAQIVKVDAGFAFSYSQLRYDREHNPKDRAVPIAPNKMRLEFADLAPADQREFAETAKRILAIPREEFAHLFSKTEEIQEGLRQEHWVALLDGLIARKNLFLKAFAPETDKSIVDEIETAQIRVAKKLEQSGEVSGQKIEEILAQEKEEAVALAELRVRLAVVDVKESEPKKVGECKTFQLPSKRMHFVGREEALAALVKQLGQIHGSVIGQSISGIGGVGKTQLALRYAQAAARGESVAGQPLAYDYVVWLNAEVFLEGQFQAMAELWTGKHLKANEAVEAVYRFLKGKRALLVFDNAENARSIAAFLPPPRYNSQVHFLITSRSTQWGEIPAVKLGGFSLEEAQEYIEYHLGQQPNEVIRKLVEMLQGLPLAMSQAVAYIKAGHSTLEGFAEQFYLNQANLLSHELLEEEAHPKTVGTTLTLCLAQAKVRNPLVEKLLGIIAYFAAEGIRAELIERGLGSSKEEVEKALKVLESYSLVSREGEDFQVHRLVQEVMRHRHKFLKEPHSYWNKVVELLSGVVFDDSSNLEGMRQCSHAIAHVKRVSELCKRLELIRKQELALGRLLTRSGMHQQRMGNYEVARSFQEQVLEIAERHYGPDHVQVAGVLAHLGNANGTLGNTSRQKELLERALAIKQRHYGTDHIEVAVTLTNLSLAYGDLGNVVKQKELLERALLIKERHYGINHIELATTLTNLGRAYGDLGDMKKAKEFLERALTIKEMHYGPDHIEVAITLLNLGIVNGALGHAAKKRELLERALIIKERFYGADHPEVARVLVNLGNAYGDLGDASKKRDLLERALIIKERFYGTDHPEVAKVLGSLGNAYGDLGDLSKKKDLLERAFIIGEQRYGPDDVRVAETLSNLGAAYVALGDALKAKGLLERALIIEERYYGSGHAYVAVTLLNLGNVYSALGDACKAKELLERALVIEEKHYGSDHMEVAKVLVNLGIAYGDLGDAYKKRELLERALIINANYYGPDHVEVAITLLNLGFACLNLNQISEAMRHAQKTCHIFRKNYGEKHPYTQRAMQLLQRCSQEMAHSNLQLEQHVSESLPQVVPIEMRIAQSDSQAIGTDLEMVEIIVEWVESFERQIASWEQKPFDTESASIYVGMVLEIMRTAQWEQFVKSPTSYEIPEEAVAEIAFYKDVPRILREVNRYTELVEEVTTILLSGEGLEGLKRLVEAFRVD